MKFNFRTVTVFSTMLFLSACYRDDSPKNLLNSVAVSVEKNDLKAYTSFFSGAAKIQYGNAQGMEVLRSKGISASKKLSQSKAVLLSETQIASQSWLRVYGVNVLDAETARAVANTQVACTSTLTVNRDIDGCAHRDCLPSDPDYVVDTACTLSALTLR